MKIELKNISKRYRWEWIFKNINYSFEIGQKYAVLGPNGSGKSTLLRTLSGHLSPTKGQVLFSQKQQKIEIDALYKMMSYSAPYIDLIEELTLSEMLAFHQKFKPFIHNLQSSDLLQLLQFSKAKHKEVRHFSSGMKQRLKLVLAICSDTPILLLDEPTTNLDQQGIIWYRDLVAQFCLDRLFIVASNVKADYDFCDHTLHILDYKQ